MIEIDGNSQIQEGFLKCCKRMRSRVHERTIPIKQNGIDAVHYVPQYERLRQIKNLGDKFFGAGADIFDALRRHITGCGNDLIPRIHNNLVCIRFYVPSAHLSQSVGRTRITADSEFRRQLPAK
jgi:hypothetical protein